MLPHKIVRLAQEDAKRERETFEALLKEGCGWKGLFDEANSDEGLKFYIMMLAMNAHWADMKCRDPEYKI